MKRRPTTLLLICSLAIGMVVGAMVGCGDSDPFNTDQPRRGPAMGVGGALAPVDVDSGQGDTPPPPPPPPPAVNSSDSPVAPPPPPASPSNAATAATPAPPDVERTTAGVGVDTKKGHGYGTGFIATPVAAYFSVRERIAFNQVKEALNLYKAINGHAPKTNEEFMEKIIKENQIQLPELRGSEDRYVYDPEKEELMVEKPR